MAKDQKLSLNPTKISGICGRLMCCLKYENGAYDESHCKGQCGKQCHQREEDILVLSEESVLKALEEQELKGERGSAVPTAGKGRQEGRHKKGEKNRGKSEKV